VGSVRDQLAHGSEGTALREGDIYAVDRMTPRRTVRSVGDADVSTTIECLGKAGGQLTAPQLAVLPAVEESEVKVPPPGTNPPATSRPDRRARRVFNDEIAIFIAGGRGRRDVRFEHAVDQELHNLRRPA